MDFREKCVWRTGIRCIVPDEAISLKGGMRWSRIRAGLWVDGLEVLWTSGTLTGMSDAQLVSRFIGVRDTTAESAFRELVHRHGPMVMGVCRQILRRAQDAEDAFQATFLILVRKARSVQVRESLAPLALQRRLSDSAAGAGFRLAFSPGRNRSTGSNRGCT